MTTKTCFFLLTAFTVSMSVGTGVARAADKAPAPPIVKSVDKPAAPPVVKSDDKPAAPPVVKSDDKAAKENVGLAAKPGPAEITVKGELTCAKCGLHETDKCQNVLRVKNAGGAKDTKYYLTKNVVSDENHSKVCGGSAPATVTGTVTTEGGKKNLVASAVKFD